MSIDVDARLDERGARDAATGPTLPTMVDVQERRLGPAVASAALLLSGAAAGWMAGGLFGGGWARVVPVLGLVVGIGTVAASYRRPRAAPLQYLVLPLAAVVAAATTFVGNSTASLGDLPDAVADALRAGGLGQPPVPFDPGWRFVLVVVFAVLGAAAASLALGLNRVNVGVFLPVPLLFATGLLQPREGSLATSVVSLGLLVAGIAVAYGAELGREGATTGQFELRRMSRATAALAGLVVAVVALNQAGFLFPEPERDVSTPPKKPTAQALASDRVLFTVRSDVAGPWRIGVLDVYRDGAFLLPPFDRSRLVDVRDDGRLPSSKPGGGREATFTLVGVEGHQIPNLANARRVTPDGFQVAYDPRTQLFRLADKSASTGLSYAVDAADLPSPDELRQAGPPPPELRAFVDAPAPPGPVQDLVAAAAGTSQWERLEFVRDALQEKVITARAGQPVDIAPSRVVEMLRGAEATPFEITAAEVLLARWAGVPARLGHGYYGGEPRNGVLEVHPRHGATWLEVYFDGFGWIALTDVPKQAKGSLSQSTKQANSSVVPSDELALSVYVPVRLSSVRQLYDVVRYWLLVSLPFGLAALVIWRGYPAALRALRRARRRRWAAEHGFTGRITVAHAEFRDAAQDLSVGHSRATPLEFLGVLAADDEHAELGWLVTRALWGDLGRDLRQDDAEAAEAMARSLTRRLRRAQPATTRLLALGSTASLREPYAPEVPNVWPSTAGSVAPGQPAPSGRARAWMAVPLAVAVAVGAVAANRFAAPDRSADRNPAGAASRLPDRLVPDALAGLEFRREPSAEEAFSRVGPSSIVGAGRVFTVRKGGEVLGYLQVAEFEPGLDGESSEVRRGILDELATGEFQPQRVGPERIFFSSLRDQTFRVWFPPGGAFFELLVARKSFGDADRLFASLIEFQRRGQTSADLRPSPSPPDPRRGGDTY